MKILMGVFWVLLSLVVLVLIFWRLLSRRWSLPCPSWLHVLVELDNPFAKANRSGVIIEHLKLKPGMKILDAGCGTGRLTIPAARNLGEQSEIVAMDVQEGMLNIVKKKAQAENLKNIRFLQAKIGEGKLESNYYDRILLITVLGEIPEQVSALKELFKSLKPGGILLVSETIFDIHFQSRTTVTKLAQEAGFKIEDFYGNRCSYNILLVKPFA
jgi:ubiquinone/menaquinone biosynthesis C-methylase UbiE